MERPTWIPPIDMDYFRSSQYRIEAVKLAEDKYLIVNRTIRHRYGDKATHLTGNIVSRAVLAATQDYYLKYEKARLKAAEMEYRKERGIGPKEKLSRYDRKFSIRGITKNRMTYHHQDLMKAVFPDFKKSDYWNHLRELQQDLDYKINDMEIQSADDANTYTKGEETSYGDSGTKDNLLDTHGVRVKRQNGSEIKDDHINQIAGTLDSVFQVFGNRSEMSRKWGLKISHSGNVAMHARKAIGLFFPRFKAIGVSGGGGEKQFGFTMAHEFGHFMDYYVGNSTQYRFASDNPNSTAGQLAKAFRDNMQEKQKSRYQNRTCECFARALEQYHAYKTGDIQEFASETNHPSPKVFETTIVPLVEAFFRENDHLLKSMRIPLISNKGKRYIWKADVSPGSVVSYNLNGSQKVGVIAEKRGQDYRVLRSENSFITSDYVRDVTPTNAGSYELPQIYSAYQIASRVVPQGSLRKAYRNMLALELLKAKKRRVGEIWTRPSGETVTKIAEKKIVPFGGYSATRGTRKTEQPRVKKGTERHYSLTPSPELWKKIQAGGPAGEKALAEHVYKAVFVRDPESYDRYVKPQIRQFMNVPTDSFAYEDVVQESLIAMIMLQRKGYYKSVNNFAANTIQILKNQAYRAADKYKVWDKEFEAEMDEFASSVDPAKDMERMDQDKFAMKLVQDINEEVRARLEQKDRSRSGRLKRVWDLHMEGKTNAQIAAETGQNFEQIKTTVRRANDELRKIVLNRGAKETGVKTAMHEFKNVFRKHYVRPGSEPVRVAKAKSFVRKFILKDDGRVYMRLPVPGTYAELGVANLPDLGKAVSVSPIGYFNPDGTFNLQAVSLDPAADMVAILKGRDTSKLVKKVITNAAGKKQTVWVKPQQPEPDKKKPGQKKPEGKGTGAKPGTDPAKSAREQKVAQVKEAIKSAVKDMVTAFSDAFAGKGTAEDVAAGTERAGAFTQKIGEAQKRESEAKTAGQGKGKPETKKPKTEEKKPETRKEVEVKRKNKTLESK